MGCSESVLLDRGVIVGFETRPESVHPSKTCLWTQYSIQRRKHGLRNYVHELGSHAVEVL